MNEREVDELHEAVGALMRYVLEQEYLPAWPRLRLVDDVNRRWPKAFAAMRQAASE